MKTDDGLIGTIFVILGASLVLVSFGMPQVAHIDYGPGLLPLLVGFGFCFAGAFLIFYRALRSKGAVIGLIQFSSKVPNGGLGIFLVLGCIFAYVVLAKTVGFLLLAPVLLFVLTYWFERRFLLSAICAVVGTIIFHILFYQLMSAPLPWGLLLPWAGALTW